MREVLQCSLGPFPWALATGEGSFRETKKAALANEIEKLASDRNDCMPRPTDCTIDAMAIIQKHKPDDFCRDCEYFISKTQD